MKICLEGWSKINHSFSLICRRKLIELAKLPIDLKYKETNYLNPNWNEVVNYNGFSQSDNSKIELIHKAKKDEFFDLIYRIEYPYNFIKGNSKKLFIFGTSEFQNIEGMFRNEIPANFSKREDLNIITTSNWSKIGFVQSGFNSDQVKVVPCGVDTNTFYPISLERKKKIRKKLKLNLDHFIISNIGGMSGNKGIDYLIVLFAILKKKYKNLRLILKDQSNLYGTTAHQIFLKTKQGKNGHLLNHDVEKNIIFISKNMTLSVLNELYNISDCYISPYRAEGFNMPPLEAAATGTPIIVTKGGSTDDYFHHDLGFQIDSELINVQNRKYLDPNLESLIEKTSNIIENPNKFKNKNGIEYVKNNFSWDKIVEKLLKVF